MRALRAWRIVDELKLDESASARLFPILAKFDEREMSLAVERRDIARELRAELGARAPTTASSPRGSTSCWPTGPGGTPSWTNGFESCARC